MGQEHDEARGLAPFVFCGNQEVVDDDLRAVHEVAELGFPHDKGVFVDNGVAVLETKHSELRKKRVVDPEPSIVAHGVGQWDVHRTIVVIDKCGVAMGERASTRIFAGHTN